MERITRRKYTLNYTLLLWAFLIFGIGISTFLYLKGSSSQQVLSSNNSNGVIFENKTENVVHLSFIGDLLMHTAERKSGYDANTNTYNFDYFFKDVNKYFKSRDYVIGSFETPIVKEKEDKLYSGFPVFKNPPEYLESIKNAGINTLVTSNNHVLDLGTKGAISTMDWIEHYGLDYTGTYKTKSQRNNNPVLFLEKNNIKVALLNYTQLSNQRVDAQNPFIANFIDTSLIKKDIEFAKLNKADQIIVWFHFGNEYERHASEYQKKIVSETAKYGADIIIGSHPHVIQPFDVLDVNNKKVFVAYAIGNFISNQYWRYSTDGLILNIDLEKKENVTTFKNVNYIPTAVIREYFGPETKNEKAVKSTDKDYDFITGAISRGILKGNEIKFRIVDVRKSINDFENNNDKKLTEKDYIRLKTTWEDTTKLIGENEYYKIFNSYTSL